VDINLHPTRLAVLLALHTGRGWERLAHLYGLTQEEIQRLRDMKDLLGDAHILRSFGYDVKLNVRMGRREVDVVGVGRGHTLCIDCKQWDRPLPPSMARKILKELGVKCGGLEGLPSRRIAITVSLRMRRPLIERGLGAALPFTGLPEFLEELPVLMRIGEI